MGVLLLSGWLPDIRDRIKAEYFLFLTLSVSGLLMLVSCVDIISLVVAPRGCPKCTKCQALLVRMQERFPEQLDCRVVDLAGSDGRGKGRPEGDQGHGPCHRRFHCQVPVHLNRVLASRKRPQPLVWKTAASQEARL